MFKWIDDTGPASISPSSSDSTASSECIIKSPELPFSDKTGSGAKCSAPVSIVPINTRNVAGGGSYGVFRLFSGPRTNPTTSADRLAAQLVRHLDGPQKEVIRSMIYFECLPARLGGSSALRDTVALFCSAWFHVQRGSSAYELTHLVTEPYGKAIKSLQKAIDDPLEQLRPETLAAICVLERFDVLFNMNRTPHRSLHGQGICSLMYKKGPPNLTDDLDMRLALEGQTTLVPYWMAENGHNFFLDNPWAQALDSSRAKLQENNKLGWLERNFGMDRIANYWPAMIHASRFIHANLHDPAIETKIDDTLELLERLRNEVETLGGDVVEKASGPGLITVVESARCPGGYAYDFAAISFFELLAAYFVLKGLFIKMTIDILALRGTPTDSFDEELARLCRGVCMLGPYVLQLGPIGTKIFSTAFYFVYPLATEGEAEFCLEFIDESDRYMRRLPKDQTARIAHIMKIFHGMVGHSPFPVVEDDLMKKRKEMYAKAEQQ